MSKPLSFKPDWSILTFSHNLSFNSGLVWRSSKRFKAPITNWICRDFANICDLILYLRNPIISLSPEMKAPVDAIDFAKVAKYTSIWSCTPCSSPAPAPVFPSVPKPCASSTNNLNLNFFFNWTISLSFPCSPLIPKTPSEITKIPPPVCSAIFVARSRFFSRLFMSLCWYVNLLPRCSLTPSTIQAWASMS